MICIILATCIVIAFSLVEMFMSQLLVKVKKLRKKRRDIVSKCLFHVDMNIPLLSPNISKSTSVPLSVLLALVYESRSAKVVERYLRHYRPNLLVDLGMVAYLADLYLKAKKKMPRELRSIFIHLFREMYRLFIELDVDLCRVVYPSWILVANYVKANRILRSARFDCDETILRDLLEYARDLFGWYIRCLLMEELLSLRLDPFFVVFAIRVIPEECMEKLKKIYGAEVVDAAINGYVQQARRLLRGDGDLDADILEVLKVLYRELTADVGYA